MRLRPANIWLAMWNDTHYDHETEGQSAMSLYHSSQDVIMLAEKAIAEGDHATAARAYAEAARLQRAMVDGLPAESVRTRQVFTRSYRSLARRARKARRLARKSNTPPGEAG